MKAAFESDDAKLLTHVVAACASFGGVFEAFAECSDTLVITIGRDGTAGFRNDVVNSIEIAACLPRINNSSTLHAFPCKRAL